MTLLGWHEKYVSHILHCRSHITSWYCDMVSKSDHIV